MSWQWARPVLLDDLLFTSGFRSNPLDTMYSFFYLFILFYFFSSLSPQVLDGMLAQYGAVQSCEQGKYAVD